MELSSKIARIYKENNLTDWYEKSNLRAKMNIRFKDILQKTKFPKNYIQDAIDSLIEEIIHIENNNLENMYIN